MGICNSHQSHNDGRRHHHAHTGSGTNDSSNNSISVSVKPRRRSSVEVNARRSKKDDGEKEGDNGIGGTGGGGGATKHSFPPSFSPGTTKPHSILTTTSSSTMLTPQHHDGTTPTISGLGSGNSNSRNNSVIHTYPISSTSSLAGAEGTPQMLSQQLQQLQQQQRSQRSLLSKKDSISPQQSVRTTAGGNKMMVSTSNNIQSTGTTSSCATTAQPFTSSASSSSPQFIPSSAPPAPVGAARRNSVDTAACMNSISPYNSHQRVIGKNGKTSIKSTVQQQTPQQQPPQDFIDPTIDCTEVEHYYSDTNVDYQLYLKQYDEAKLVEEKEWESMPEGRSLFFGLKDLQVEMQMVAAQEKEETVTTGEQQQQQSTPNLDLLSRIPVSRNHSLLTTSRIASAIAAAANNNNSNTSTKEDHELLTIDIPASTCTSPLPHDSPFGVQPRFLWQNTTASSTVATGTITATTGSHTDRRRRSSFQVPQFMIPHIAQSSLIEFMHEIQMQAPTQAASKGTPVLGSASISNTSSSSSIGRSSLSPPGALRCVTTGFPSTANERDRPPSPMPPQKQMQMTSGRR